MRYCWHYILSPIRRDYLWANGYLYRTWSSLLTVYIRCGRHERILKTDIGGWMYMAECQHLNQIADDTHVQIICIRYYLDRVNVWFSELLVDNVGHQDKFIYFLLECTQLHFHIWTDYWFILTYSLNRKYYFLTNDFIRRTENVFSSSKIC